ncbi:MAG TPA: glycosyltransferase family 1 protein [Chloroflexi bacterium]|nr:glycosyltransferase family 1 protein [Chloroflexota bacterium]
MRLLLLSSEFPPGPGGIGTHAYQLARTLTALGWEVAVLTAQDHASEDEVRAFNSVQPFEVLRLPSGSSTGRLRKALMRWLEIRRAIRARQPDVILASGQRIVWLAALAARWRRVPWAAVGHGTEFGSGGTLDRVLTRWSFQQADRVICVSEFTLGLMLRAGIRPRSQQVIANGADATRFTLWPAGKRQALREALGLGTAPVLLTVGNVTERKGQDIVIRALPRVLEAVPDVQYVIAGLPTQREAFEALAAELGVGEHVHFTGRVDSETLVGLMNICDLFIMTSRHVQGDVEGYGIAVVEAALCGKAAVVSANSGLVEAIVEGETGLSVPEGDPDATAEAICALLTDDARRQRMGEAARARALAEQTWERRARAYDASLKELAAPTGSV